MNLGWKSAIYTLAKAGEAGAPTMLQSADQIAGGVAQRLASGGRLSPAESFTRHLGAARTSFAEAISSGIAGADDVAMAARFGDVAQSLDMAARTSVRGTPAGHAQAAARAAREVSDALRVVGTTADGIPERTHMAVWDLRNHLDLGWNELGMAKVTSRVGI